MTTRRRFLPGRSLALAPALLAMAAGTALPAQAASGATLQVLWRAGAVADAPPALAECLRWLATRPEWPANLPVEAAFTIQLSDHGLAIQATAETPPAGALWAGALRIGAEAPAVGEGRDDGTEDWWIPATWQLPPAWQAALQSLGLGVGVQPRTLDAASLLGQLTGPTVEGDHNHQRLLLGSQCGEVTFACWQTAAHWRVRGRGEGGLLLPACLVWLQWQTADAAGRGTALRVMASRDGDQPEAARQLLHGDQASATAALRAALHGEDELRLAAITTLVRRQAAQELPRIVAAGETGAGLAVLAAQEALVELWPGASAQTRAATQRLLQRSEVPALRQFLGAAQPAIKPARAPEAAAEAAPSLPRAQWLLALGCLGAALYIAWLRERHRRQAAPAPVAS